MAQRKRRGPRPVSLDRLKQGALRYLGQRDASRAQLRRVLVRRVDRALRVHGGDRDEALGWVDEVLVYCERLGYLEDARYARGKARSMRRRGASERKIRAKLAEKGVAGELVDAPLEAEGGDAELVAALRLVRRRRFGPFARAEVDRDAHRKQLAALGRAGFGYDTARRALEMDREEAEERLHAAD